jgi:hypothetical protein
MGFYEEMADVARELLAPTDEGGLGQGTIELVRYLPSPAPVNAWDPPAPSEREITVLDGVARGVGRELIGAPIETGGQIVATDLTVTVAPWPGTYQLGDVLEVDDRPVTVLKAENIPAAGVVCAVRFVVRR